MNICCLYQLKIPSPGTPSPWPQVPARLCHFHSSGSWWEHPRSNLSATGIGKTDGQPLPLDREMLMGNTSPLHVWYMFLNICFYDQKLWKTKTKTTCTSCWSAVQPPFEYMQKVGASSHDLQSGTNIYIYILSPLSAVMVTLKQW